MHPFTQEQLERGQQYLKELEQAQQQQWDHLLDVTQSMIDELVERYSRYPPEQLQPRIAAILHVIAINTTKIRWDCNCLESSLDTITDLLAS